MDGIDIGSCPMLHVDISDVETWESKAELVACCASSLTNYFLNMPIYTLCLTFSQRVSCLVYSTENISPRHKIKIYEVYSKAASSGIAIRFSHLSVLPLDLIRLVTFQLLSNLCLTFERNKDKNIHFNLWKEQTRRFNLSEVKTCIVVKKRGRE
jgi:hypothetical protein